ncbi:MAG TPA: serine hydrolase domain-containing protein [Blastocatellia bacterium]|nr:serine hydrolase domain-containing protein [Blastocatellia bacterium]
MNRSILTRSALALMLALAFALPAIGQAPVAPDLRAAIEQVDALAAAEYAKDNRGSVTIGIVSGAELVWTKSYGYADMEKKAPATKDTVYRIGSITKQFTGLMLLQLVEAGKAHLSDPVEKYFPEVNKVEGRFAGAPPITIVQLATHTSGLGREPADLQTYLKGTVSEWEKVMIAALPRTKYDFEPGTRFSYSNIGYAILGATLSRAAGQSYVEYAHQKIFAPLGMTHTAFEPNEKIKPHLAKGYGVQGSRVDAETPEQEHQGRGYKVPNGAMYTTVGDLARFLSFELGYGPESVLKKVTLEDNFKRVNSANGDLTSGYGIGFQAERHGSLITYGHGGAVAGYLAGAFVDRASGVGVIVLRNVSGGSFDVSGLVERALETLAASRRGSKP